MYFFILFLYAFLGVKAPLQITHVRQTERHKVNKRFWIYKFSLSLFLAHDDDDYDNDYDYDDEDDDDDEDM